MLFERPTAIADDVYFLDYTFKPGGNPPADCALWRKVAGRKVVDLYNFANSGNYDFFVDATRKDGPNAFAKHVPSPWAHLNQAPCKFFAYVVQACGARVDERGFHDNKSVSQRHRATLNTLRTVLALRDAPLDQQKVSFRHLKHEGGMYRFEAEEAPTRVAVLLAGVGAHWMNIPDEPGPQPIAGQEIEQPPVSSGTSQPAAPSEESTSGRVVVANPPRLALSRWIWSGNHETAIEVTVTNSGGPCFFRNLRLSDESGVIPWTCVTIGKLRAGSQRLQRGRQYPIPPDSVWSGTVYVCGASEERFRQAYASNTFGLEIVYAGRDGVPVSLAYP